MTGLYIQTKLIRGRGAGGEHWEQGGAKGVDVR